jgi:hypothetical protein
VHFNFEDQQTLNRLPADPAQLVSAILGQNKNVVCAEQRVVREG